MKFRPIMLMTSYLCKSPARYPNISDNGHFKHENNFWKKSTNRKFWPSRRFSHGTAHMLICHKMLLKIQTSGFVKIFSIPDEELFSETAIGCALHTLSKLYDVPVGFVNRPPPSHLSQCIASGCRRVAAARYLIICLVRLFRIDDIINLTCTIHIRWL